MDNQPIQSIREILERNEQIAITVGKNPNIDEMGAALALYLSLSANNKKVTIASPTDPIVELSNLVGINKVKSSLATDGGDLVVSFPYKEGEIEKVSYTLEDGYLNIVVKAGEMGLSFSEKDVKYKRDGGGSTPVLFIVGTPRLSNLGSLFNPQTLKNTTVVNIDNKPENQGFGDVVYVSPTFSSVSEQIANIINSLNLPLDQDVAQNLMSGISFATDNFQKPTTSSLAFEMAGILMKKGALRADLNKPKSYISQTSKSFSKDFTSQLDDDDFFGLDSFTEPPIAPPQNQQRQNQFQNRQNKNFPKPLQNPQFPKQQSGGQPQQPQQAHRFQGSNTSNQQFPPKNQNKQEDTPPDWLAPKIYKGSTSIE